MTRRFVYTARVQQHRVYDEHNMKLGKLHGYAEQNLQDAYPFWLKQQDLKKRAEHIERYRKETITIKRRPWSRPSHSLSVRPILDEIVSHGNRSHLTLQHYCHLPERHDSQQT